MSGAEKLGYLMGKLTPDGANNFAAVMAEMGEKGAANFGTAIARMGYSQLDAVAGMLNTTRPEAVKMLAAVLGSTYMRDRAAEDPPGCARMLGGALAVLGGVWLALMIVMFFVPPAGDSTPEQHRTAALIGGSVCGLLPLLVGILLLLKTRR